MGLKLRPQGSLGHISCVSHVGSTVIRTVGAISLSAVLIGSHAIHEEHNEPYALFQPDLGHYEAPQYPGQPGIYQQISSRRLGLIDN